MVFSNGANLRADTPENARAGFQEEARNQLVFLKAGEAHTLKPLRFDAQDKVQT
jgi:hypothetical protein